MSARWRAAPAISRSPMTPCRATTRDDPVCADRAAEPVTPLLDRGIDGLRIAVAGGYFKCRTAEAVYAIDRVAAALGANRDIEIPRSRTRALGRLHHHRERGASLHLDRLRTRARDFDPAVRDRLIAGAMLPASLVIEGAEIPPLVSRRGAQIVRRGRRHFGAGDALHGAADRAADI